MPVLQGGAYTASYTAPAALQGATVALTVTAPDGTVSTAPVTVGATSATATIPATLLGSYLLVWIVTGTVQDAVQDQFTVMAPTLDLIDLVDLKDELNLQPSDRSKDAKLRRWLDAATHVIENVTGPIRPQPRTDYFDGETTFVVLPYRWVAGITLITETRGITNYVLTEQPLGQSINAFGYTWDRTINKITRRGYGGGVTLFPPGEQIVTVQYTLGMATLPLDIQTAAAELIKHWYAQSQTPGRGTGLGFPGQAEDQAGVAVVGNYFIPNAVMERLAPWRRRPGVF